MKHVLLAVSGLLLVSGCTVVSPEVGQEAVLVDRPWVFGKGGVRLDDVRKTGRSYAWLSTEKIYVDTTPQTIKVAFNDYSSSDNILLDFETAIQYRITNSPRLLSTKGTQWFENNIRSQYSAIVRDQVKRHDMTSMMSKPETAAAIDQAVTEAIRAEVKEQAIDVEIINITLGRAQPNPNVLEQMNLTAAQQQRVKTLKEATLAEEQRKLEQEAVAAADNAYRNQMGLSPQQYLLRQVAEINAQACVQAKACYIVPSGTAIVAQP